jgi:hypothetical protein
MALDEYSEADLVAYVLEAFRAGTAMTRRELLQMVRELYDTALRPDRINASIGRHLDALKTCRSLSQENTPLIVGRAELEEHIQTMKVHIASKFRRLGGS